MTKKEKSVLTIRIDNDLDHIINEICERKSITKASLIRNYLEMIKYVLIYQNSFLSSNNNDLLILKRSFFKSILSKFDEDLQIDLGIELAQFINDLARLEGNFENIEFKLDLCEHYGLFPKFIDRENYILISHKFGPQKFVEAFMYQLIKMGTEQDFDKSWTEEELSKSKDARKSYKQSVNPIVRDSTHYSFEFAKISNKTSE
ncbi:MAG: hypothetical protein ACFFBP_17335 [Promethearchaeota archaeon]